MGEMVSFPSNGASSSGSLAPDLYQGAVTTSSDETATPTG